MEMAGLSELQKDLLKVAQQDLPKEIPKIMRKIGNKAKTQVAKKARSRVVDDTGMYNRRWKRGKVFKGDKGETVVRVINSAPHAHLIEYGHRQVTKDGKELGFVLGFHNLEKGMKDFNSSGQFENMLSNWIDDLLRDGKL